MCFISGKRGTGDKIVRGALADKEGDSQHREDAKKVGIKVVVSALAYSSLPLCYASAKWMCYAPELAHNQGMETHDGLVCG